MVKNTLGVLTAKVEERRARITAKIKKASQELEDALNDTEAYPELRIGFELKGGHKSPGDPEEADFAPFQVTCKVMLVMEL